jgi:N-acetylglucosaminyl-diphospho-decaprenol L-rhamnosyltransferase
MMMRRADWNAVGGLDERYFLFMSDVEICRRIRRLGKSVAVSSCADVRADGIRASAGGIRHLLSSRALRYHFKDSLTYYVMRTPIR